MILVEEKVNKSHGTAIAIERRVISWTSPKTSAEISSLIAYDKGKPAARQGRKAVNLLRRSLKVFPKLIEIVWLPKVIRDLPERHTDAGVQ